MKTIKLYRWINKENTVNNINEDIYLNFTDNFEFAKNYGDIILEYKFGHDLKIQDENIKNRFYDISLYDKKINNMCIDGYKWKISKNWIFHYRLNTKNLKLSQIYYVSEDLNTDIANITYINRKILWLKQSDFWKKLNIPRVKISEYENKVRTPSLERITELTSLVKIKQILKLDNTMIQFG